MSESKEEELVEFQGKRMYPEVAAYFETKRQAEKIHNDAHADASYTWEKAVREAQFNFVPTADRSQFDSYTERRTRGNALCEPYQVYTATINAADRAFSEAVNGRREGLRTSIHPEVRWIEANALSGEQSYSEAVLRALPVADPSELWDVKRQYNMCAEFDRLYAAAELDGVFNNGKKVVGARQRTALNNWVVRNWGSNYARQLMQQISPLMKEIEAERVKELEDAKAEWQGLDEAWRSERSRRGAATRAANRETVAVNGNHPDVTMDGGAVVTGPVEVEDNTGDVPFSDFTETRESRIERVSEELRARVDDMRARTAFPNDPFEAVSETEEKVDA